jgi:hypothetical protein
MATAGIMRHRTADIPRHRPTTAIAAIRVRLTMATAGIMRHRTADIPRHRPTTAIVVILPRVPIQRRVHPAVEATAEEALLVEVGSTVAVAAVVSAVDPMAAAAAAAAAADRMAITENHS